MQRTLRALGFALTRVGGRGDRGVDLRGRWIPPHAARTPPRAPLAVLVQCKAERLRAGPKYMRELEGTLRAVGPGTIGVLASSTACTPGLRSHMQLSRTPLAYFCIATHDAGAYVRQMLWNAAAGELIGYTVGVTTRYITGVGEDAEMRKEVVLTVDGEVVETVDAEAEMTNENELRETVLPEPELERPKQVDAVSEIEQPEQVDAVFEIEQSEGVNEIEKSEEVAASEIEQPEEVAASKIEQPKEVDTAELSIEKAP